MLFKLKLSPRIILAITICIFMLTGCTVSADISTLLVPPKLSDKQTEINNALTSSVGTKIKLKYPKSGDYRSPFIVADIDDEPTDEAIVFYEKTDKTESVLRMNILDQDDGKWVSVADHPSGGTEIDKVIISQLGDNSEKTILAGYTLINQNQKSLEAYSYSDKILSTLYTDNYSYMGVMDINNDKINELLLITNSIINISTDTNLLNAASTESTTAKVASAKFFIRKDNQFIITNEVAMDENAIDYTAIVSGNVGIDTPALFVDTSMGNGQIQTQILYCVDGQLINPLEQKRDVLAMTARPVGYSSMDINNDGIVEIPVLSPFPGYEAEEDSEKICMTDWYVFEQYALIKKSSGYYNVNDSYCFMLPSRWQGTVTVKHDTINDDVVFYKYSGTISDDMTELMRISVMKRGTNSKKLADGYQTFLTKGQMDYMYKIPDNENEPLVLTKSELMFNFYVT